MSSMTLPRQVIGSRWRVTIVSVAAMTVRVTKFAGEYAELAAWTGEPEEQLRAEEDYHEQDRDHWLAWDGEQVVGALHPWRRLDNRHTLYFDTCRPDAYAALAEVIDGECYSPIDAANSDALEALTGIGFVEHRREHRYEIPLMHIDATVPDGLRIVTADRTDLEPLMMLDCALREDIPGSEGWRTDRVWFREETYDSPFFDPLTYRVALDGDTYVGLARVWLGPRPEPRLGMVGVLAAYRRRGLGRALIAQAFAPLVERGEAIVVAEADATNVAPNALFTGLGGNVVGGTVELRRPARSVQGPTHR
jgi:ribosomal protein S18 acetylase RimI-like enzyme